LFQHIRINAAKNKIQIDRINGYLDHVHCLIRLNPTQTISEVARLLKGESSHWFNHRPGQDHLQLYWQEEYFAISVSESILLILRLYIDNQEQHHSKQSFAEEYNAFMKYHNFCE
jgi:REP element-mobilizing transposase RayT